MVCLLLALDSLAITQDSLRNLKGSFLLLDVRSPSFFEGVPLGASYNLPFPLILDGYLPPKGYDYYVTVCSCPTGGIAKKAAQILRSKGLKAYYLLRWKREEEK